MRSRSSLFTAVLALPLILTVACSDGDDGGDQGGPADPSDCNTSMHVVGVDDQNGVTGQFGAEEVVATMDDEVLVLTLAGFELPRGYEGGDDLEVPDEANLFVVSLTAPDGGFAEGQRFSDGGEPVDGTPVDGGLEVLGFARGQEDLEADGLLAILGPISDGAVCGSLWTDGAGLDGTFRAGLSN